VTAADKDSRLLQDERSVAAASAARSVRRTTVPRLRGAGLAVIVLLTGLTLLAGYFNKARCVGPTFDQSGRSQPIYEIRRDRDVCDSDIQNLWLGRDIDKHVFPYVSGGITADGTLYGGALEYPVLTGLLIWASAIFASTDGGFLLASALLMAPFGLLTGWMLGRLSGWRALIWALGPPLVLYAFHNWDLPVVACSVGAAYVMHGARPSRSLSPESRAGWAAALLGLGFGFKLYPGIFVLPLAAHVLSNGEYRRLGQPLNWFGTLKVLLIAMTAVVAVNLPFALAGYDGWLASFTFQQLRKVDGTGNSIWYWAFRPDSDPANESFQAVMNWVSPTLVLASFALALALGWRRYRRRGGYPWIGVSAAMLCGFLLLHKVHSPQYTLWLLPFFVLLRIGWGWVAAYLIADLAMGIGIFRWYYVLRIGTGYDIFNGFTAQAVMIGVWGRAALLVALFELFLRADTTFDPPLERAPPAAAAAPAGVV
jgi:uncharacterized membrane protein